MLRQSELLLILHPVLLTAPCFELSDIVNVLNDLMKPVKLTSFLLQVCFKRVDRDRKLYVADLGLIVEVSLKYLLTNHRWI